MQRFTRLKVWQRSHALALNVYRVTESFPRDERFGVISQMRRAATSVPTNIAEGAKRDGAQDYARFLNVAQGSLAETEYLTMLSRDLGYLSDGAATPMLGEMDEIGRMLEGLRRKVRAEA